MDRPLAEENFRQQLLLISLSGMMYRTPVPFVFYIFNLLYCGFETLRPSDPQGTSIGWNKPGFLYPPL
jgi:hypothetical protein